MLKNLFLKKNSKGFTLIELLVVMAIIAVLVALIIYAIMIARRSARDTQRRNNVNAIKAALEERYSRYKIYPVSTGASDLTTIEGLVGVSLDDPNGENNRYYYKQGTCDAASTQSGKYCLRLLTEAIDGDSSAQATNANGEDFSNL